MPAEHLLDAGYIDGPRIVTAAQEHGITLTGPIQGDTTAQAAGPYNQTAFTVDWGNKAVTCPNGNRHWSVARRALPPRHPGHPDRLLTHRLPPLPARTECISSTRATKREITLRPRAEHEAIRQARAAQGTPEWRERYAARNGIEGTISHAVRSTGLRQSRYHGLASTSSPQPRSTSHASTPGPPTGPGPAPEPHTWQHFAPPSNKLDGAKQPRPRINQRHLPAMRGRQTAQPSTPVPTRSLVAHCPSSPVARSEELA
ncbi:transposase [Streptomyces sp. NPDC058623]|uniref:transposase n=1 Tax=Streptomyces sp. NPDC058623 TaxID=3346563 RepID=UPI003658A59B